MRRIARYGLGLIWVGMLALHLPEARDAGDALGMVIFVSVFVFLLAVIIGLAGLIGEALTRRRA